MKPGYYLVTEGKRHFIGTRIDDRDLEHVLNKLYPHTDPPSGWWVDYCMGLDVHGAPAWGNVDRTDWFLDAGMARWGETA